MNDTTSLWLAVAFSLAMTSLNFTLDVYAQNSEIRYCQKHGSDEVIIVRKPALCPPGTREIQR